MRTHEYAFSAIARVAPTPQISNPLRRKRPSNGPSLPDGGGAASMRMPSWNPLGARAS